MKTPRIALPQPTSTDPGYDQRSWPQYAHAIRSCGGVAVPVPLGESQSSVARLISGCSAILLPGSPADLNPQKYNQPTQPETAPSDPAREAVDELLLQDAFNLHKPIFGICYGLQALNVWRSGTLRQHIGGPVHETDGVHAVQLTPGSRIARMRECPDFGPAVEVRVNSSHHQSVEVAGDGLQIAAVSSGDGVIEALELSDGSHFALGVQWHPERSFGMDALSRMLFRSFVAAAASWKLEPIQASVLPGEF